METETFLICPIDMPRTCYIETVVRETEKFFIAESSGRRLSKVKYRLLTEEEIQEEMERKARAAVIKARRDKRDAVHNRICDVAAGIETFRSLFSDRSIDSYAVLEKLQEDFYSFMLEALKLGEEEARARESE